MSAFRPQGRLPLDPFDVPGASPSLASHTSRTRNSKENARGKPSWTVREEDVQEAWRGQKFEQGRVVLVLGAPTEKDLAPLLRSPFLSKSLVILATEHPPNNLSSCLPQSSFDGPALVVLRLQPLARPIPQHLHSVLTRAEVIAHRWRQDRNSIFSDSPNDRGRSLLRRQKKSGPEDAQVRAVQFSESGGVFGRDFSVREDIGYTPDFSLTSGASSSARNPRSRAPYFSSATSLFIRKNHDQRAFDALINFVPVDALEDEEGLLQRISSVSTTSRIFLSSVSGSSSSNQRGRSLSRTSRGRSSSLDRIRGWISRSRSRSKTREAARATPAAERLDQKGKGKAVLEQDDARGICTASPSRTDSSHSDLTALQSKEPPHKGKPEKIERSRSIASERGDTKPQNRLTAAEDRFPLHSTPVKGIAKRAEHGVLASWSRTQLKTANRVGRSDNGSDGRAKSPETFEQTELKAHLIHILPLSPPSHTSAILHTNFSHKSSGKSTSNLHESDSGYERSSLETDMSSLEANRITGKDIKDSKVSHSVPPIQKPESVKSSEAVALNVANSGHKRSGSLDSSAFPSQSSSPRSIPILHTTASALLANSARLKYLKDGPDSSSDRSRAGQTAKSSSEARVNAQISQSLLQRRASMISPALEAAIESATRDSSRPNYRALSQTTSKTDMQLQRRSTAMQVASAAAMAAMEVSLVKTNQAAGHIDHLECMGRNEQQGDSRLNTRDEETREKVASNAEVTLPRPPALSTNIPDVLLPHPHRQGTLILRESIFAPLDIQDIIGNSSPKPDKAKRVEVNIDLKPPTPIALLPRPHARARTLSMDEGRRPADDFDTAPTRVAESTLLHRTTLSSDTLPSSHPDYYFERTAVVEYLEKYLLSYSYVDSQSTPSTPIKTLPKGAAKPVTIGGARAVNTAGIASQSSRNAALPDSQTQRNPPPASYLLPQGLMDLCWKFSPDNSEMSIVDLILCGLLDPSSESLAVYQNAMTLAAKISNDGENITLDGLMALGALNGEDAGAWHRLPKAWIGGIADIDVQGATPQSFAVPVNNLDRGDDITLVRKDLSDVDLPRNPTAFPTPNLASVSIPRATLSAVDLHAQTVALSSRASSTSPEAPRNRSVSRERVRSQPATPLTPRHPVNEYVHPNTKPDTDKSSVRRASATTTTPDTSPELNTITLLHRIVSPPKLSPLVIPFTKTLHSAVPPGAALPANPHLPSVFSSFPRHSAMFIKPPNLNLPTSPQSTKRPDIMEDDEREKAPYDNESESEDASDITSSSDALLSPVAISPSLAGTDAIFNEESDPPNPPSDDIQVTVNVVSLSDSEDDTSVIAESIPPPKNSFLFDHSAPEADAASILTQDSQTPTAPHPANSIIATRNASESTNTEVSCGEIQRRSTLPKDFPSITVGAGAETHVEDMTSLDTKVSKLSRSSTFNGRISTEIEPAGSETPTPTQENMKPSMPNTPASVATLAQNSASSPRLSILSLPLNNLSALPTHPNGPTEPDRASLSSESCLSSPSSYSCSSGSLQSITASPEPLPATSLTPPSPSTVINRRQPYLSLRTSSSLARRHSNGGGLLAPPVGPREPKRSRSLRVAPEETSEVESAPVQVMSPIPRRPLPIPVMEPVADRPNTDTIVSQLPAAGMSGLESEGKSGAGKTSGEPDTRAVREIHEPKDKMRSLSPPLPVLSSSSRPNSRGNTPTPIAPLRKLAIDELPIRSLRRPAKEARTEGPRPATIAVAMANSVEGDRVVENVVAVGSDSAARRSKWKFWASEDKPVSVMVDLTREI